MYSNYRYSRNAVSTIFFLGNFFAAESEGSGGKEMKGREKGEEGRKGRGKGIEKGNRR